MSLVAKTITICRTEGLAHTLGYLWKFIAIRCALYRSETFFFRRDATAAPARIHTAERPEFIMVNDALSLEKYACPRLTYVPYRRWFAAGSVCFLGLTQGTVVSYCWVHKGSYSLKRVGRFELGDNELWLGPVFVDKRHQGRGINTAQLHHAIHELSHDGEKVFFTATNAANYGSMKSLARCGFVLIGLRRMRMLGRRCISRATCDLNDRCLLEESLA